MKLLKMRICRTNKDGATHYDYPTPYYKAELVRFGPIYEGGLKEVVESDVLPRNAGDEFILVGVDNIDVSEFLKAEGFVKDGFTYGVVEVDRTESLSLGNKWTKQVEKILDQNKVLAICAKVAIGGNITKKEKDALDPDNSEIGINKTAPFEESLDKFLNQ